MSKKSGGDINHSLHHTFSGAHMALSRLSPSHHVRVQSVGSPGGTISMFFIHILISSCSELQMQIARDSQKSHWALLDVFHLFKENVFIGKGWEEMPKTGLVEVELFASQVLLTLPCQLWKQGFYISASCPVISNIVKYSNDQSLRRIKTLHTNTSFRMNWPKWNEISISCRGVI